MSKAVLISIRPRWVQKIADGKKTVEVRKTRPKLVPPFKCYIYCTQPKNPHEDYLTTEYPKPQFYGGGKVVGEFTCTRIVWAVRVGYTGAHQPPKYVICKERTYDVSPIDGLLDASCLALNELESYLAGREGYGWHISDFQLYDKPRDLSEFERPYECGECDAQWATECNACHEEKKVKRAPQSWCYVEEKQ